MVGILPGGSGILTAFEICLLGSQAPRPSLPTTALPSAGNMWEHILGLPCVPKTVRPALWEAGTDSATAGQSIVLGHGGPPRGPTPGWLASHELQLPWL